MHRISILVALGLVAVPATAAAAPAPASLPTLDADADGRRGRAALLRARARRAPRRGLARLALHARRWPAIVTARPDRPVHQRLGPRRRRPRHRRVGLPPRRRFAPTRSSRPGRRPARASTSSPAGAAARRAASAWRSTFSTSSRRRPAARCRWSASTAPTRSSTRSTPPGLDVTESRGAGWADVLVAGARPGGDPPALGPRARDADRRPRRLRGPQPAGPMPRYAARVGAAGSGLPSGRTTYRSYDEVQAELKKLVEDHPDLVRPITIGKTFQGRDIQGVEIAKDVNAEDGRPTFFLMGEHHAREWPSEEIAMEYATMLANGAGDARDRQAAGQRADGDRAGRQRRRLRLDAQRCRRSTPTTTSAADPNVELVEAVAPPGGILAYRRKNCDGARARTARSPASCSGASTTTATTATSGAVPARARTRRRRATTARARARSPRPRRCGTTPAPTRSPA